ncbi:MAG: hypothetical protein DRJ63_09170 [Thermoprotei archaeon]|nr:MAG: hypothetical protein DRJ63_09170 [Thermoprotei archaeon]
MAESSPIVVYAKFIDRLRKTAFIDYYSNSQKLIDDYDRAFLKECLRELERMKFEVSSARLYSHHRQEILSIINSRIIRLKEALEGVPTVPPRIDIRAEVDKEEVYENEVVKISYIITNPYVYGAKVRVTCRGRDVEFLGANSFTLYLNPGESRRGEVLVLVKESGEYFIGPITVEAVFADGRKLVKNSRVFRIVVKPYKPSLEVKRFISSKEIVEGEAVEVSVTITNTGTVPLKVSVAEPVEHLRVSGEYKWRGQLKPGESKTLRYKIHLPKGTHSLPSTRVVYRDPRGREWEKVVPGEVIKVKELPPPPPEEVEEVSAESLVEVFFKSAFSAGIGYLIGKYIIGRKFPEVRKYPKPVFIKSNIPWRKVKSGGEEVTVLFEDPIATVQEDHGSYVIIRPASLEEIISATDVDLARTLQLEFSERAERIFRYWRPRIGEKVGLDIREHDLSREEIELIERECKEKREPLDENKLRRLPRNMLLEFKYSSGGLFRKREFIVYVLVYSRLRKLYYNSVDHKPLAKAEALRAIEGKIREDKEHVLILASPTGWDQKSIEEVETYGVPGVHIILVNLKTNEVYYDKRDPVAQEIVSLITRGEIPLPPLPEEAKEDFDKLTEMLVKGEIGEKEYLDRVLRLIGVAPKIKISEKIEA